MVNRTARRASGIVLLLWLAGISVGSAPANGSFPSGRTLESADGPLPGCRKAPVMTFSAENGRLGLRVCCNHIGAAAVIEGDRLRITGPMAATQMHCGAGQAAEDQFLRQIDSQQPLRWRLEGEMLILESDPPLRFRIPPS
jgi:heat shock protein HslJ